MPVLAERAFITNTSTPPYTPIGKEMLLNISDILPERSGVYYYDSNKKTFDIYNRNNDDSLSSALIPVLPSSPDAYHYHNRTAHINTIVSYD